MRNTKRILFTSILFTLNLNFVNAQIRPLVTLNLGLDFIDQSQSQDLVFIAPFHSTY